MKMKNTKVRRSSQHPIVAGWYNNPPTPMAPTGKDLAPGNIVFVKPTCSQHDAGLKFPVALPVQASKVDKGKGPEFCYASYELRGGELHYHPLLADVEYEILAPHAAGFREQYMHEIKFAQEVWHQVVNLDDIVTLNMLVAMRHTSYTKGDGTAFRQWIGDYLGDFAGFHDMMEFHSSGLRLNWTFENKFPPLVQ